MRSRPLRHARICSGLAPSASAASCSSLHPYRRNAASSSGTAPGRFFRPAFLRSGWPGCSSRSGTGPASAKTARSMSSSGNPEERRDSHDLVERRSPDPAELPPFDRAGADADDLPEPRAGVARRLAALLKQSAQGRSARGPSWCVLPSVDLRISPSYSSDLLPATSYRITVVLQLNHWYSHSVRSTEGVP